MQNAAVFAICHPSVYSFYFTERDSNWFFIEKGQCGFIKAKNGGIIYFIQKIN